MMYSFLVVQRRSTAYYGGSGNDVAYLTGQSTDYTFSTVGAPDFRLTHTGTGNANHDFYSIEIVVPL